MFAPFPASRYRGSPFSSARVRLGRDLRFAQANAGPCIRRAHRQRERVQSVSVLDFRRPVQPAPEAVREAQPGAQVSVTFREA
jgi:hypothetical protein